MNDRLERELVKMTPEQRQMWEEIVEEEEQAMMELLESWEMAGVKKYAGEKKKQRDDSLMADGVRYVWSQRFGDWINPKTGEGLVGEHCITGEKHTEARELLQFMEEELEQQTPEHRRKGEQMLTENEDELFEMLEYWRKVKTKNEVE